MSMNLISLRALQKDDLDAFFEHQKDEKARYMAAFVSKNPNDKQAFLAHWDKVLADESIVIRTILNNGRISGHILCHSWFGDPELTYWLDKSEWGRGIATEAVRLFVQEISVRPLFTRIVKDNMGSQRVLEKNGFVISDEDKGFANGRNSEAEEFILKLN